MSTSPKIQGCISGAGTLIAVIAKKESAIRTLSDLVVGTTDVVHKIARGYASVCTGLEVAVVHKVQDGRQCSMNMGAGKK